DSTVRLESAFPLLVQLVSIRNLSQHTNYCLSRQAKAVLHFIVKGFVEFVLPKGVGVPSVFRDVVGCIVGSFKCVEQGACLLLGRCEFDGNSQLHILSMPCFSSLEKKGEAGGSSPCVTAGVSAA